MIAIFFTIASAFIKINATLRAKPSTIFLAKMYERMFDDQKFAHIFQRLHDLFIGEVEDPVHIKR